MDANKVKRQIIIGLISFGIFIISGSIQVIFSPFPFVRNLSLITVIFSSVVTGAFIRELFILKEKK